MMLRNVRDASIYQEKPMITCLTDPTHGVVELTVEGGITRPDYDRVVAEMEGVIARSGKLRLIEIIRDSARSTARSGGGTSNGPIII